jgi:hypothetical protein
VVAVAMGGGWVVMCRRDEVAVTSVGNEKRKQPSFGGFALQSGCAAGTRTQNNPARSGDFGRRYRS